MIWQPFSECACCSPSLQTFSPLHMSALMFIIAIFDSTTHLERSFLPLALINNTVQLQPKAVDGIKTCWPLAILPGIFRAFTSQEEKLWCFGVWILWRPCYRVQPTHEVSSAGHSFILSLEWEIKDAPTYCNQRLRRRKHPQNESSFHFLCVSLSILPTPTFPSY